MDIHILFFIAGLFNFIQADGRLIQKNKTKTIEEVHSEKPNPVIRLTRDVTSESMDGFTKESAQTDEFIQVYNRRTRHFNEETTETPKSYKLKRITRSGIQRRDSKENGKVKTSTTTPTKEPKDKPRKAKPLVKKPIPKFNDVDYEDFQSMMSKVHITADSGDREDDDFNIADYEFDINHDEYASGRRHFEPRIRIKNLPKPKYEKKNNLRNVEDSVMKTKPSNKKERSVEDPKQTDQSRDTEYYDEPNDENTKGQRKGSSRETQDDQYSDENDDRDTKKTKPHIRKSRSADWSFDFVKNKIMRAARQAGILPRKAKSKSHNVVKHDDEKPCSCSD